MIMKTTVAVLCALLLAGACTNDRNETADGAKAGVSAGTPVAATSTELTPEQLGELGAAIRKNPNDARRLLSERGLTEQSFEQAIRKVAEDPAASRRYTESYKKAGA